MLGIIYKITNIINGKFYIGQTVNSVKQRFNSHASSKKSGNIYFHNAIKKYGKLNFKLESIDSAQTPEELNAKEIAWIGYYKSMSPKLIYNISNGGRGIGLAVMANAKECLDVLTGQTFASAKEMANFYNLSYPFVIKCLNGKQNRNNGQILRYKDKNLQNNADKNAATLQKRVGQPKPIKCVETGEIFGSIQEASQKLKVLRTSITNMLIGRSKTAKNLRFSYIEANLMDGV